MRIYFIILSLFFSVITFAQNTISGTVTDDRSQPVPGANVKVIGSTQGTSSGFDGKFILKVSGQFPLDLEITMVGYSTQNVTVNSKDQEIVVVLSEQSTSLNEIVVSASRAPERILESPVTIERMGLKEVKNTTAPSFYDGLENLKDVHFNTSSFNFKSINTRGFATVANSRFMQLVDGMDNSSPALNFVLGNLLGVSDVDVASVEILPGASSALYGANAFNGIMFMNSRNPFNKEGISAYFKYGMTSQKAAGENPFRDFGVRVAKKFTDHFAAKANFTYMSATEWIADDRRSLTAGGEGHDVNQNYDGLNSYGDEVSTFISNVGQVSRTGYAERDLNDNKIESAKFDGSLHLRPWANSDSKFAKNIEIIGQYKVGFGNTIYQGANRYRLQDFFMDQTKIEIKGDNFFVRAYRTAENAGNSYDMRFAAWNVNRLAKSDTNWFTDYARAFQLSSAVLGLNANDAANYARTFADTNVSPILNLTPNVDPLNPNAPRGARFEPGSAQFNQALASVIANPDLKAGAKFQDNSKIHHSDVNYNFKDVIKVAEVQVGGSARQYTMDSNGTIFTDSPSEPLKYTEYGAYTQIQKKILDDRMKLTGSLRYDKSQNFDGSFSPRLSVTYGAGAEKQHNFRASYQTGFRNPTTQDQYIGLDLGPFALIGSAPDNLDRYTETMPISTAGQADPLNTYGSSRDLSGQDAYFASYSAASVRAFAAAPKNTPAELQAAADLLQVAKPGLVKPEKVQAVELGYRTSFKGLSVDLSGYYNMYQDFINTSNVIKPLYGDVNTQIDVTNPTTLGTVSALNNGDRRVYQVYTNSKADVQSYGVGLGLNYKLGRFDFGGSYNFSGFEFDQSSDPDFEAGFNTPKHRAKASFGSDKLFKNFGFNTSVRYNSEYLWQASFVDAMVPENVVFDAQINYAIPFLKSVIKVGGANLFGKDYIQVPGAGSIGQQYYASWTINP
jgi:outer membrane receptor protein involved in Fe transport